MSNWHRIRLMLPSPAPFRAAYILLAVGAVTLAVAFAGAEDVWKLKPPSDWTAEECVKVLEDSPWARRQSAILPFEHWRLRIEPTFPSPTAPDDSPQRFNTAVYLVRWESAEPVQAAFVRLEELGERARARSAVAPTRWPSDRYVITVKMVRLPDHYSDPFEELSEEQLRNVAELKTRQGKFRPEEVERRGMGEAAALHFYFARQRGKKAILEAEAETVVFRMARGKFKLETPFLLEPEWLH